MANSIPNKDTVILFGAEMPSAFQKRSFPNEKRGKVRKQARNLFNGLIISMEKDFNEVSYYIDNIPNLFSAAQNNKMKDACVALNELALGGLKSKNDKIRTASISATTRITHKNTEPKIAERNIKELSVISCTETDEENQRLIFYATSAIYSEYLSIDGSSTDTLINITNGIIIAPVLMIMGNYKPTGHDNQMGKLRDLQTLSKNSNALEYAKEKITAVAFKERAELLTSEHQAVRQTAHEHIAQSYLMCDDPKMKQTMAVTLVEAMQKEKSINPFKLARGNITTILTESGKKNETMTEDDLFLMNSLFDLSKCTLTQFGTAGAFYPIRKITETEDIQDKWLADFANKANTSLQEMALRDATTDQDQSSFTNVLESLSILATNQKVAEVTQGSVVKSVANFLTDEIIDKGNDSKSDLGKKLRTELSSSEVAAPYLKFNFLKDGGAFEYQPDPKQSAINDAHLKVMQSTGKGVSLYAAKLLETKLNGFNDNVQMISNIIVDPEFKFYEEGLRFLVKKLENKS